ncbi:MAG: efflux RND transporter periplasmic adaptor subunit [Desulfatirhabdiaceae bacterium]
MRFNAYRFSIFQMAVWFCILFSLTGCKKEQPVATLKPPEVTVQRVTLQDVPVSFEFVAQTQSSHMVNIHARVNGFLDKHLFAEGMPVREGQVLFQIDPKPFQVQLAQASAALTMQQATLETARANLARIKPLAELKALSQKDLDDATGQFESAAAAVEQSRAQVETARLNLSYTTITAPISGIAGATLQTDGTYISTQNSLLTTVTVLSPMWVNFSVSENQVQRLRREKAAGLIREPAGDHYLVEIILVDGSVYPHTGKITFADPAFNSETGTFLIRASVENPKRVLRPNQFVRVRLRGAVRPRAILAPQRAVQQGGKGHFVWVVGSDNKTELRPVVVGDWYENDWFISEGLSEGDQVITDGVMQLRPDMTVTLSPGVAAQKPAPVSLPSPAGSAGRSQ